MFEAREEPQAQNRLLSLLRQLKYIESIMLQGKNVYTVSENEEMEQGTEQGPNASDVEMILLDLL
jgi:hypothetical protein